MVNAAGTGRRRRGRWDLAFAGAGAPGGWADLPVALARLNLDVPVGADVRCSVADGYPAAAPALADVVGGAGFVVGRIRRSAHRWVVDARRDRTLPDFVGAGMRLLVCGLNPSVVSADAGFGYAGATNRFWSVAVAAGLVTHPRRPLVSLTDDGVGMTDLVKRATRRARSGSAGWSSGCGRGLWCSSGWPGGGPPSTGGPLRAPSRRRSVACRPT